MIAWPRRLYACSALSLTASAAWLLVKPAAPVLPFPQDQFKAVGDQVNATKLEAMKALMRHFQASSFSPGGNVQSLGGLVRRRDCTIEQPVMGWRTFNEEG